MFDGTADPDRVTTDDVAGWCEKLGSFIKDNPDATHLWLQHVNSLYHKIKAVHILKECQRETAQQTPRA